MKFVRMLPRTNDLKTTGRYFVQSWPSPCYATSRETLRDKEKAWTGLGYTGHLVYAKHIFPILLLYIVNETFGKFKGILLSSESSGTSRTVATRNHSHLPQNYLHAVGN